MAKGKPATQQPEQEHSSMTFKGTFIAVMFVGVFILLSWFGSYALFISR